MQPAIFRITVMVPHHLIRSTLQRLQKLLPPSMVLTALLACHPQCQAMPLHLRLRAPSDRTIIRRQLFAVHVLWAHRLCHLHPPGHDRETRLTVDPARNASLLLSHIHYTAHPTTRAAISLLFHHLPIHPRTLHDPRHQPENPTAQTVSSFFRLLH
jgi:hypothetical protein